MRMSRPRVIFYYDVVCPFAYMASRLVEAMGQRTGAEIVWRPVLLGQMDIHVAYRSSYSEVQKLITMNLMLVYL